MKQNNWDYLLGKKFGRLTIQKLIYGGETQCLCQCECGNSKIVRLANLKNGTTKSCGCLQREKIREIGQQQFTHHLTNSPIYKKWISIRKRCNNPNAPDYKNYGGRGIKMCEEWDKDFLKFYEYVKPIYKPGLQIDRIDNDRGYEPGNIRFVTAKVNTNNRRTTIFYKGIPLFNYCKEHNIDYWLVNGRIKRGWGVEKAITTPIDKRFSHSKGI